MALEEAGWGSHPIEIVGSDASEAALAKAQQRLYRERSFRTLPPNLREKYFDRTDDGFVLRKEIASRVRFHWANLMQLDQVPTAGPWQVIFCRNVFIYFSEGAIRHVASSFATRIPAGGNLFIGASESLLRLTDKFELRDKAGAFVYVRNEIS
jgi:chemotaxis protein methyltransferase CheR